MKRKIWEKISLVIDLAIFVVGMPIIGFAYFVIDPLIAYYERVKAGERTMPREYLLIKLMEPIREEYFSGDNCAPKLRGEGCYGDCVDCFHRDKERYERISKLGKKAVYHE